MRFSLALAALAPALSVYAETHLIMVGAGGKLAFSPPNITAKVNDVVAFQFQGKNHSVTQSTFGNPCAIQTTPAQGIDSGFQFVPANATSLPEWSFTVNNDTAPLWFYCVPRSHCQAGMVFSVNAKPDSDKSFAVFQAAAMGTPPPSAPAGGAPGAPPASGGAPPPAGGSTSAGTPTNGPGAIGGATSAIGGAVGAATSAIGGAAG
ncbi:Cupredoxin, partial [Mycena belliarum]